ncbi:ribonuclease P protein component [Nakamurella deserti]|uniref:ribonuclease P protein component n=1 Tax=Nakamurella deserti TaxID=2164074 RepID=UPI00197C439E
MLPVLTKAMRVTRPAEFSAVLRTGRRAGTKHLALHLLRDPGEVSGRRGTAHGSGSVTHPTPVTAAAGTRCDIADTIDATATRSVPPARAGFVVSSAVGNSVIRHRVTRRLRDQVRPLLTGLPPGTAIVVRAFPAAATATSAELGRDLRTALQRVRSR